MNSLVDCFRNRERGALFRWMREHAAALLSTEGAHTNSDEDDYAHLIRQLHEQRQALSAELLLKQLHLLLLAELSCCESGALHYVSEQCEKNGVDAPSIIGGAEPGVNRIRFLVSHHLRMVRRVFFRLMPLQKEGGAGSEGHGSAENEPRITLSDELGQDEHFVKLNVIVQLCQGGALRAAGAHPASSSSSASGSPAPWSPAASPMLHHSRGDASSASPLLSIPLRRSSLSRMHSGGHGGHGYSHSSLSGALSSSSQQPLSTLAAAAGPRRPPIQPHNRAASFYSREGSSAAFSPAINSNNFPSLPLHPPGAGGVVERRALHARRATSVDLDAALVSSALSLGGVQIPPDAPKDAVAAASRAAVVSLPQLESTSTSAAAAAAAGGVFTPLTPNRLRHFRRSASAIPSSLLFQQPESSSWSSQIHLQREAVAGSLTHSLASSTAPAAGPPAEVVVSMRNLAPHDDATEVTIANDEPPTSPVCEPIRRTEQQQTSTAIATRSQQPEHSPGLGSSSSSSGASASSSFAFPFGSGKRAGRNYLAAAAPHTAAASTTPSAPSSPSFAFEQSLAAVSLGSGSSGCVQPLVTPFGSGGSGPAGDVETLLVEHMASLSRSPQDILHALLETHKSSVASHGIPHDPQQQQQHRDSMSVKPTAALDNAAASSSSTPSETAVYKSSSSSSTSSDDDGTSVLAWFCLGEEWRRAGAKTSIDGHGDLLFVGITRRLLLGLRDAAAAAAAAAAASGIQGIAHQLHPPAPSPPLSALLPAGTAIGYTPLAMSDAHAAVVSRALSGASPARACVSLHRHHHRRRYSSSSSSSATSQHEERQDNDDDDGGENDAEEEEAVLMCEMDIASSSSSLSSASSAPIAQTSIMATHDQPLQQCPPAAVLTQRSLVGALAVLAVESKYVVYLTRESSSHDLQQQQRQTKAHDNSSKRRQRHRAKLGAQASEYGGIIARELRKDPLLGGLTSARVSAWSAVNQSADVTDIVLTQHPLASDDTLDSRRYRSAAGSDFDLRTLVSLQSFSLNHGYSVTEAPSSPLRRPLHPALLQQRHAVAAPASAAAPAMNYAGTTPAATASSVVANDLVAREERSSTADTPSEIRVAAAVAVSPASSRATSACVTDAFYATATEHRQPPLQRQHVHLDDGGADADDVATVFNSGSTSSAPLAPVAVICDDPTSTTTAETSQQALDLGLPTFVDMYGTRVIDWKHIWPAGTAMPRQRKRLKLLALLAGTQNAGDPVAFLREAALRP